MLYKETVSREMWELLQKLMKDEVLKDFTLVGGTALSLQIGHRLSVDIDLFSTKDYDSKKMLRYLCDTYGAKESESILFNNTVLTYIDNIKVDIVTHKYPLINPIEETNGIRMVSCEDIAAMKLHAIFESGQRLKDFVDMYFLLDNKPLKCYLQAYEKKYNGNIMLARHSLSYFENISKEYNISIISGKEKEWTKMAERLKKAVIDPEQTFGVISNKVNQHTLKKRQGRRR